jgi:hypothetical protein
MGLRSTRKLDLPDEEGEWIEAKFPSQMRIRALMSKSSAEPRQAGEDKDTAQGWALMALMLQDCIVAWSFSEDGEPVPVNEENITDLDGATAQWLFNKLMGKQTAEEKKAD